MSGTEMDLERTLSGLVNVAREEQQRLERTDVSGPDLAPLTEAELEQLVAPLAGVAPAADASDTPTAKEVLTIPDLAEMVLTGSDPERYEVDDVERNASVGAQRAKTTRWLRSKAHPAESVSEVMTFLQWITAHPDGSYGALVQVVDARSLRGRRVRLSARVRTENVAGQAGLWLRVDGAVPDLVLDNMADRPIIGTRDWQTYEIVLDVPPEGTGLAFGVWLEEPGQVWLQDMALKVVSNSVPVTSVRALVSLCGR